MSDMLSIGASGVRAYQTALSTTSENIANAGTAGYVRRTTTMREVSATNSLTGTPTPLGVTVSGIARAGDIHRSAEVRNAGADLAKTEASVVWLERIENALSGSELGDRLTEFFNSSRGVAADPSAVAPRAVMLETASSVAAAFTATSNALSGAASDLDATADNATAKLNGYSAALAKINSGLGRAQPGTVGAASLLDQRDQLLESMSALTDIDVSFDAAGRATVKGGNQGPTLVHGDIAATVTYVRNDEGAVSFAAHFGGHAQALTPSGGALAGVAEGAQRIASARDQLDTLASGFVEGVNAVQAQGSDLSGNAGAPMFEAGDPPSHVTMTMVDPRGIAAAAAGGGTRDNGNLAALESLRSSGGFEDGITQMTTANGAALSSRKLVADAQTSIRDSAVASRDSATGVNLDEEAVDLIRFQQAYQASSRVIQVARETLQSILDIR